MKNANNPTTGFSLIELLVVSLIFTVITGAVFSLLLNSQIRYQSESSLTQVFQQANVAIDQITRDIHSAGYPPVSAFTAASCSGSRDRFAVPFAWAPNYSAVWPCNTPRTPLIPCVVNATCTIPGPNDLILEADLGQGVQWIRYSLSGTTLSRAVTAKNPNIDPVSSTDSALVPYLDGVLNGNRNRPIFTYKVDPKVDPTGLAAYGPADIGEVNISLIVQAAKPDPQNGQFRMVTLTGQAIRLNPNQ